MVLSQNLKPMPRRQLRLKEWAPLTDQLLRPTVEYLEATDGSLRDIEYRIRTNSDGFIIPPPMDLANISDTVIFFGDSFVESTYVPENQRFVADVQSNLIEACLPTHCFNAGYSGASSLHMLMSLIGKVGRRPSTTIVFVVPSNDAFALLKKGGFWCQLDKRYSPLVPVPNNVDVSTQPLDLTDLLAVLNLFVDACHRLRLGLVLATFPHRTAEFDSDHWLLRRFKSKAHYARSLQWRNSVNSVVRSVANRLLLPFVDLETMVSMKTDWFYDDVHMNEAGSAGISKIFSDFLISMKRN